MDVKIYVPQLGESITEASIAQWYKKPGEAINIDEPLCELETDKVTIEVPSPCAGVMGEWVAQEGDTVAIGALLGKVVEGAGAPIPSVEPISPVEPVTPISPIKPVTPNMPPSVRKLVVENGLNPSQIPGTGKGGRLTKADALNAMEGNIPSSMMGMQEQGEERVKMTRLRKTIAKRLKESQNTAATLTTFNEVDMSVLMGVRKEYKEQFEQKHGVKLGFMSFFIKACVMALKEIPAINSEIQGEEIVYKQFVNMGVAVGTDKGLVVPVLRQVDTMTFAGIEKTIANYGAKAREGGLVLSDLQGGTFTISNGGVYGSLMSTPILNSPQSGILGMHKIQDRPVVVNGEICIRPMMYLALSYDHRIVDGKEAVIFLVRVKEGLENPERLLLDL